MSADNVFDPIAFAVPHASAAVSASFPSTPFWVPSHDYHTAGEPFRIVPPAQLAIPAPTPGLTVRKRRDIVADPSHPVNTLRIALCQEPRGHADMYGGFITAPDDGGAHFGVLFWHKDGFSTACGHGTIALGFWAVERGVVAAPQNGEVDVRIDVPSGRVTARVTVKDGRPVSADFVNVPSYLIAKDVDVVLGAKTLRVDIAWGGAAYAYVHAPDTGLAVEPRNHDAFVRLGREVKAALGARGRWDGYELYGVSFVDDVGSADGAVRERNVVIYGDGNVDRSPTGSSTAARVALLVGRGRLAVGKGRLENASIIDTKFTGVAEAEAASQTAFPAVVPRVTGHAGLVGECRWYIDVKDETFPGFTFR
ncbi:Trans-3-hydroxy-L-proline dehydratase [Vanrija pseudolonga]|uniref:trans-L-3-hydroxyproline dehydratase n=1 Tax=Vanrija pseudolonga TaxID=143232 RepID=A0AAF0YCF8_9TREE|nr:Trans-3-hydroxy-L-proline dehydratase [Vanrija pseudolonga]